MQEQKEHKKHAKMFTISRVLLSLYQTLATADKDVELKSYCCDEHIF